MLVRVESGTFVAGFVICAGKVIEAAPILRKQLMGRTTEQAREIIKARRWRASTIRSRQ